MRGRICLATGWCFSVVLVTMVSCSTPSTIEDADTTEGDAEGIEDADRIEGDVDLIDDAGADGDNDEGLADGGDGELPELEPGEYCERAAPLFCPFYLRCGRLEAADDVECEAAFVETCNAIYESRYVALSEAGLLSLSSSGLMACGEHLAHVSCDDHLMDLEGPCALIWTGHVAAGGGCGYDLESFVCAPGTRCVLDLSFCGTCTVAAEIEEVCGGEVTCGANARCSDGRCVPRADLGDFCESLGECRPGSYCRESRCEAPRLVGALGSCGDLDRCRYMTSCVNGVCEEQSMQGQRCDATTTCASGYCAGDGHCAPFSPAGASCDESLLQCLRGCADGQCGSLVSECM